MSFSEDKTCNYSSSWYSDIGSYIFDSTNCSYETGKDNNIKITIDGTLKLYNNYIMDYQTEEVYDYVLNGIYKYDNKSHLLLNGLTYEHDDYYSYFHYGVNEVLVDYTGEIYKPDGSKFWTENENKIDLSLYKMVDKRQINNNASSYVNEYDKSNLVIDDSLIDMGCIGFYDESYLIDNNTISLVINDIDDANSVLTETPTNYFLYIGYVGDEDVYNLEVDLKPLIDQYKLRNFFYFLNITDLRNSDANYKEKVANVLNIDESIISDVPVILYFKDSELLSKGIFTAEEFKGFLESN